MAIPLTREVLDNLTVPLEKLISDYLDEHIRRLIVGQEITHPPPTEAEIEEAGFTKAILACPEDDTARKVFADWLDEHGRPAEANYLRTISRGKFVRRVRECGGFAMFPPKPPPRVADDHHYYSTPPPARSPRCEWWVRRIQRGWRPNHRITRLGYSEATRFFGVYVWEYITVLSPMLWGGR